MASVAGPASGQWETRDGAVRAGVRAEVAPLSGPCITHRELVQPHVTVTVGRIQHDGIDAHGHIPAGLVGDVEHSADQIRRSEDAPVRQSDPERRSRQPRSTAPSPLPVRSRMTMGARSTPSPDKSPGGLLSSAEGHFAAVGQHEPDRLQGHEVGHGAVGRRGVGVGRCGVRPFDVRPFAVRPLAVRALGIRAAVAGADPHTAARAANARTVLRFSMAISRRARAGPTSSSSEVRDRDCDKNV